MTQPDPGANPAPARPAGSGVGSGARPPQGRLNWVDHEGLPQQADWRSLAGQPAPAQVLVADETLGPDAAWQLVSAGTGLLWCGSYAQARRLLQQLGTRFDRQAGGGRPPDAGPSPPPQPALVAVFQQQRQVQARRARSLGLLLLPFEVDHSLALPRAPDVRAAARQARGAVADAYVASLRELLGLIGAFEWRRKGVPVASLQARIHPHHGVFSPVRGEYVDLVAEAPLPAAAWQSGALDIGTGTGVLAAVLARRGLRVTATDLSPAALACAADNLRRLGLGAQVQLQQADLFPAGARGRAGLVVCNPPWLPAPAATPLEAAVYDPDSRMLRGFLTGLPARLAPGGEGWLILSDLAEHLGLRSRAELLSWIAAAGLQVLDRLVTQPRHGRASDEADPLHAARSAERTSLWRLGLS